MNVINSIQHSLNSIRELKNLKQWKLFSQMWRMWLLNTVVFHSRGVTLNDLLKATERCASIFNEAKLEKIGALN